MTLLRLWVYVGLHMLMLLPVLWITVTQPTWPHVLLSAVFLICMLPLMRSARKLYREHRTQRD